LVVGIEKGMRVKTGRASSIGTMAGTCFLSFEMPVSAMPQAFSKFRL
jgi:hypothetical protein